MMGKPLYEDPQNILEALRLSEPPKSAEVIEPNDATNITPTTHVIVGGGGDLRVNMLDGNTVTLPLAKEVMYPLRITKIFETGSTATTVTVLR